MQSKLASEFELKCKGTVPKHLYFNLCAGLFSSPLPPTFPPSYVPIFNQVFDIVRLHGSLPTGSTLCWGLHQPLHRPWHQQQPPLLFLLQHQHIRWGIRGRRGACWPTISHHVHIGLCSVSQRSWGVWGVRVGQQQLASAGWGQSGEDSGPQADFLLQLCPAGERLVFSFFGWDYTVRSFKEIFFNCVVLYFDSWVLISVFCVFMNFSVILTADLWIVFELWFWRMRERKRKTNSIFGLNNLAEHFLWLLD